MILQINVSIGVLQETKLVEGIHTRYNMGYRLWTTEAEICHRGTVAIVLQEEAVWKVEGVTKYGTNVVIFTIRVGWNKLYVVGEYVPPNDRPCNASQYRCRCF